MPVFANCHYLFLPQNTINKLEKIRAKLNSTDIGNHVIVANMLRLFYPKHLLLLAANQYLLRNGFRDGQKAAAEIIVRSAKRKELVALLDSPNSYIAHAAQNRLRLNIFYIFPQAIYLRFLPKQEQIAIIYSTLDTTDRIDDFFESSLLIYIFPAPFLIEVVDHYLSHRYYEDGRKAARNIRLQIAKRKGPQALLALLDHSDSGIVKEALEALKSKISSIRPYNFLSIATYLQTLSEPEQEEFIYKIINATNENEHIQIARSLARIFPQTLLVKVAENYLSKSIFINSNKTAAEIITQTAAKKGIQELFELLESTDSLYVSATIIKYLNLYPSKAISPYLQSLPLSKKEILIKKIFNSSNILDR